MAYPRSCGTSDQQPRDSGCKNQCTLSQKGLWTHTGTVHVLAFLVTASRTFRRFHCCRHKTRRRGLSVGKSRCGVQVRPTSLAETYSQYVEELRPRPRLIAVMEALRLLALGQCRGLHHTAQVSVRQLDLIRD